MNIYRTSLLSTDPFKCLGFQFDYCMKVKEALAGRIFQGVIRGRGEGRSQVRSFVPGTPAGRGAAGGGAAGGGARPLRRPLLAALLGCEAALGGSAAPRPRLLGGVRRIQVAF